MSEEYSRATLENLGGGALAEKFQDAFEEVIKDLFDPNKDPGKTREINIKIKLYANDEKDRAFMGIDVKKKLGPEKPFENVLYISARGEEAAAFEFNPKQSALFEPDETKPSAKNIRIMEGN